MLKRTMFLVFNHKLTNEQMLDAKENLKVEEFVPLPEELKKLWASIPPELESIETYIDPILDFIHAKGCVDDVVLIQGDPGAVFITVNFSKKLGLVPVYATTRREAVEKQLPDGSIELKHVFKHVRFREYGV